MAIGGRVGYWRAMSQEDVEDIIRGAYAKFNRAKPDTSGEGKLASLDFYHPDAVYVNDANDPDPGIHRGIGAVREQVRRWVEAYPDLQVEPLEIQTNGDQAFVWVRFSGHGAESGVPIDMELAHAVTVKDGKVLRVEEYSNRADGLEAAGLRE
ncbi:MAG: nuclear transport factor 2 family protein [Chloroflexota bacterium]|nr:nuclear transport factor 2 family protein [Chloroflexota bacterium]